MQTVRTTIALPADLLDQTDEAVREGKAANRSELVVKAFRKEIRSMRQEAINARIRAAYASLKADELEELLQLADAGLDDTLEAVKRIESCE